ncbi:MULTISPECIES: hypothetical protein [unclassified Bradyrhizobium]|uniref:hypothetical protein n=1 Tax=unclassified Bradyrhizobium TaxID=2631580 RepID=UPI0028E48D41|nr:MULTISPECIES: hypothetical protein [unclassified Bradyrhizobium]
MVRPKRLKMINHEAGREHLGSENGRFAALDGDSLLQHGEFHERFPRHLLHLPRDYALAIRWLRPSFLNRDDQDARPAGRKRDSCRGGPLAGGRAA